MKYVIINIAIIIFFSGTCNNAKQRENTRIKKDILYKSSDCITDSSLKRLQIIRKIIDLVGFIELPYTLEYNKGKTYSIIEIDRGLISEDLGSYSLYGTLPDTNHYYGFITCLPIDYCMAKLVIFDKKGRLIDKKELLENNCYHEIGEDIYCNEYIIINKDLTMNYYYSSKYVSNLIEIDTICEHYEKNGFISDQGIIIFEKRKEFKCK